MPALASKLVTFAAQMSKNLRYANSVAWNAAARPNGAQRYSRICITTENARTAVRAVHRLGQLCAVWPGGIRNSGNLFICLSGSRESFPPLRRATNEDDSYSCRPRAPGDHAGKRPRLGRLGRSRLARWRLRLLPVLSDSGTSAGAALRATALLRAAAAALRSAAGIQRRALQSAAGGVRAVKTAVLAAGALLAALSTTPAWSNELIANGSGVIIGPHQILTANHVIDGCTAVSTQGGTATVVARDAKIDLAVLSVSAEMSAFNIVALHTGAFGLGDDVIVTGYPLRGAMASSLNLTTGVISATAGWQDDPDSYTITAPVQPGNSGGPLLDHNGNLVGIITSQIKSEIAQNANFAVKYSAIKWFLDSKNITYQNAGVSSAKKTAAEVGEKARLFTVKINCYANSKTAEASPPSQPPSTHSGGGYWSTTASENACLLQSGFTDGRALGLGLVRNFGLLAMIAKPSWSIPQGARVAASVQIDEYAPLSGPGITLPDFPNAIVIQVQPQLYSALIYQMYQGRWATVSFTGNEPPWQVSLRGVQASWPAFLQCAQHVSPMFVNQIYGPTTQPW